ncbi:MAG: hypothetical protein VB111_00235 [Clostridiaceae bacterium]|nr:hypothetical protein [Clostridiaceae bacterium]
MKQLLIGLLLAFLLTIPAAAVDPVDDQLAQYDITGLEKAVPDDAQRLLDGAEVDIGVDFSGKLLSLAKNAFENTGDALRQGLAVAVKVVGIAALCGIAQTLIASGESKLPVVTLAGTAAIAAVTLTDAGTLCRLASSMIDEMSVFSKLLLPVLVSAGAASGAVVTASARAPAVLFLCDVVITTLDGFVVPAIYCHLALSLAQTVSGEESLGKIAAMLKTCITMILRTVLTLFLTYFSLTGILSGTTDAVALKTAKLALSTGLPVVGSIMADAADAVITGAKLVRNALGVFGVLVLVATAAVPFLRIGIQFLLYKLAAAFSSLCADAPLVKLIDGIGESFGLLLGLCGTCTLLLLLAVFTGMTIGGFT